MSGEIDPRRLADRLEHELGRLDVLVEGLEASIEIDRLDIGPLDAGADTDDVASAIARGVAAAIAGGTHGHTEA